MQVGTLVRVKKDTPYIWSESLDVDDATSLGRFGKKSVGIILEVKNSISDPPAKEVKIEVDGVIGWVSTDYLTPVK